MAVASSAYMQTADYLARCAAMEVHICGGIIRSSTGTVIGTEACDFFRGLKVDYAFISCDAIDDDGAVYSDNLSVATVENAIISNAKQKFVLSDSTKLGKKSVARIVSLKSCNALITTQGESMAPQGINSYIEAPITVGGRLIGFIGADNPPLEKTAYSPDLLLSFAYSLGSAIARAQSEQKIRKYSEELEAVIQNIPIGISMLEGTISEELMKEALAVCPQLAHTNPDTRDILLRAAARIPDKRDRKLFISTCSGEAVRRAVSEGSYSALIQYRRRVGNAVRWVSSSVEVLPDPGSGDMTQNSESRDVEGIAYAINVTDRKVNDSILSRIAEERYDHIGLISPVSRSYEMWKKDGDYELSPHLRVNYDAVFGDIMKNYIFPEDQELFLDHGRIENIIARLDRDGEDSFVYRRHSDEGGVLYKQVKYVWLDQRRDLIMLNPPYNY